MASILGPFQLILYSPVCFIPMYHGLRQRGKNGETEGFYLKMVSSLFPKGKEERDIYILHGKLNILMMMMAVKHKRENQLLPYIPLSPFSWRITHVCECVYIYALYCSDGGGGSSSRAMREIL